jgi:hypothetical protein
MRTPLGIVGPAVCAASLCLPASVCAQAAGPPGASPLPPLVSGARADSLPAQGPTKSTGTAMLLSAILPGAGQFYNESYWKVPVIVGLGGYFIVEFLDNNSKYQDYGDLYDESLETTPGGDTQLLTYREFYRDQRDTFAWYFLILYAVNILDAYVDASLFDFDVGGDLAGAAHGPPAPSASLTLRVRF